MLRQVEGPCPVAEACLVGAEVVELEYHQQALEVVAVHLRMMEAVVEQK